MYFGTEHYGLDEYMSHHGDGSNMFRTENFGQPRTLQPGDVLANGLEISEDNDDAGNGGVGLKFTDGTRRVVAARIPLLLSGGTLGKLPMDLRIGDIFETGCVVLTNPSECSEEEPGFETGRHEVEIKITGGYEGHQIGVPRDLVIALYPEIYPPAANTKFGAFVLENAMKMHDGARKHLPKLNYLEL